MGNTRNQFSHIIPKEDTLQDIHEIILIKNKCELLLRVLILNQLGFNLEVKQIKKIIQNINAEYNYYKKDK